MSKEKSGFEERASDFSGPKSGGAKPEVLKIRRIGNSLGVVLPKDVVTRLGAQEGDEMLVTATATGIEIHRKDTEFEEHMRLVEKVMARYPNTLRALAK